MENALLFWTENRFFYEPIRVKRARASIEKFIVFIVLDWRLLGNLIQISMQEPISRHLVNMEECILPRQFEY